MSAQFQFLVLSPSQRRAMWVNKKTDRLSLRACSSQVRFRILPTNHFGHQQTDKNPTKKTTACQTHLSANISMSDLLTVCWFITEDSSRRRINPQRASKSGRSVAKMERVCSRGYKAVKASIVTHQLKSSFRIAVVTPGPDHTSYLLLRKIKYLILRYQVDKGSSTA